MNIDLHCHTNLSDGTLTPDQLLDLAVERDIKMLSITDHDTLDAYSEITSFPPSIEIITGIEFSSQWEKLGVHVVGLNLNLSSSDLNDAVLMQSKIRSDRAQKIAEQLSKLGFKETLAGAKRLASNQIGRPHFAQYLVEMGAVRDSKEAFRKYLGAGKPGDIKEDWPNITKVIDWIRASGGVAVLAHPKKYKMTRTKLVSLISDFCAAGGEGIEVVSGQQTPQETRELAKLANQFGLMASCGSDFHTPDNKWASLGRISNLPDICTPIWNAWM